MASLATVDRAEDHLLKTQEQVLTNPDKKH
jgi:hypothetical protein